MPPVCITNRLRIAYAPGAGPYNVRVEDAETGREIGVRSLEFHWDIDHGGSLVMEMFPHRFDALIDGACLKIIDPYRLESNDVGATHVFLATPE